jgi:hypothetical protein
MSTTYNIDGGMTDVRLAAAWTPKNWLRVGAGAHAVTGNNRVSLTQSFQDSLRFAPFSTQRILGFRGAAGSVGVQLLTKQVVASASARFGGQLRMYDQDTLLTTANVPGQFGVSLAYIGIANSAISIRTSRQNWSALTGLGTDSLTGIDVWDTSLGGDFAGPTVAGRSVNLRLGFRTRELPFQASGSTVKENSVSAGAGTAFAAGRVLMDLAVVRASRSVSMPASEQAWTLSVGLSIRP